MLRLADPIYLFTPSATSTLIRGDGGEASKILQLLSSRVERIFFFFLLRSPRNIDKGGVGSFLLKGNLQLLSSRVVQHYYKIALIGGAYLTESEALMASILLPNACSTSRDRYHKGFGGMGGTFKCRCVQKHKDFIIWCFEWARVFGSWRRLWWHRLIVKYYILDFVWY